MRSYISGKNIFGFDAVIVIHESHSRITGRNISARFKKEAESLIMIGKISNLNIIDIKMEIIITSLRIGRISAYPNKAHEYRDSGSQYKYKFSFF